MTDKHTPGPWIASGCVVYGGDGKAVADLVAGVCNVPSTRHPDVVEANAAFIVRAVNNHAKLLAALEALREDLQARLDASTEGTTVADSLVSGEDANLSWRSWLFDVMSTHGDIARAAIKAAK